MSILPSVYIIVVYITFPSLQKAQEITKTLLQDRLIACATMFPCSAMYWWDEKIQNEVEYIVVAKTMNDKYDSLVSKIKEMHPYEVPCILKLDAQTDLPYATWVRDEVNK